MERIYKFLLAYHSNYVPVLHRFWNIAQFRSKIAHFNLPHLYLVPSLEVTLLEFRRYLWRQKTSFPGLSCGFFAWSYV